MLTSDSSVPSVLLDDPPLSDFGFGADASLSVPSDGTDSLVAPSTTVASSS